MTGYSELARSVLLTPTPHAELGDTGDAALDAQLYAAAETGQLNKANDDKRSGFAIINGCEARDAEVRRYNRASLVSTVAAGLGRWQPTARRSRTRDALSTSMGCTQSDCGARLPSGDWLPTGG